MQYLLGFSGCTKYSAFKWQALANSEACCTKPEMRHILRFVI
jgi:hypothetical protein